MLAILGGLGAAFAFAGSTLCSSRSSRLIPPASVLAWVMVVGMVVVTPFVIVEGIPPGLDAGAVAWCAIAGVGNVGGLLVAYAALRIADVGLVAPILSTQGAIAAVIAVAAGEDLGAASAVALVVVAVGVVVSATAPGSVEMEGARPRRAVALATGAALVFGVGLYAIGRVGADLPVAWAVLPARLVGVVCVAAPLALAGRLRLTRAAAPLVLAGGLC
jgi:drug/metabolite transporter (DMT)-like permease